MNSQRFYITILIAGFILRIWNSVAHIGIIYPDEQFQTLEPASFAVLGYGTKTWEWFHGIRSWVVPALYMPLLWILKQWNVHGSELPIQAARVFTACLSLPMLYLWIPFFRKIGGPGALLAFALWSLYPALVVWSSTTFSDTWVYHTVWISLALILRRLELKNAKSLIFTGCLISLPFIFRLQTLPYIGTLGILYYWIARLSLRQAAYLSCGFFLPFLFQGLLDWYTWGGFLSSVFNSIRMNIFEGVADMNGIMPWYEYFVLMTKNLTPFLFWPLGISVGWAFFKSHKIQDKMWLLISVPAIVYFLSHSAIKHKELRFILVTYPVLFLALAYIANSFRISSQARINPKLFGIILFACSLFSATQLLNDRHYSSSDISELSAEIFRLNQSKPGLCVLLHGHYWIWTRGELIQGQKVKHIQLEFPMKETINFDTCRFALVAKGWEDSFTKNLPNQLWKLRKTNQWGHSLFQKDR